MVQITDLKVMHIISVLSMDGVEKILVGHRLAVSNYSEWVFPDVAWVSEDSIYIPSAERGGQTG